MQKSLFTLWGFGKISGPILEIWRISRKNRTLEFLKRKIETCTYIIEKYSLQILKSILHKKLSLILAVSIINNCQIKIKNAIEQLSQNRL